MNQSNVVSGIALTASLLALVAVGVLRSSDRSEPPAVGSSLRVIGDCRISEEDAAAIIESALMRMGGQEPEEGASMQKAAEEIMQELLERRVWTRREFDSYIAHRQLASASLKTNPFTVRISEERQVQQELARMEALARSEAAERASRIREAARQLSLGPISLSGGRPLAVINGRVYGEGDTVCGFEVKAIEAGRVRLVCENMEVTLALFLDE